MMETFSLKTFTTNKKLILGLLFLTFSVSTFLNYGKHHAKRHTGVSFFRHPALWTPVRFPESLSLADSIYWNVMSWCNFHAPEEFSLITSAENSRVYISHPLAHYRTGDTLTVFIETFNQLGYRRTSGGDFFIARAFNSDWKAGVLGTVVDMKNGKYLVMFPLLWEGDVRISIKLYHSAETVAVICKHRHRYPYTVAYKGFFVSENLIETTNCHFDLPQDGPICNFTDLSSGVQWICEKPPSLGCEYFRHIEMYSIDNNLLSKMEEKFLERDNILTEVTPEGPSSVFVHKKGNHNSFNYCYIYIFICTGNT
ncbi:NXPE family member 4-like [Protopterus annectens]|uniref:NXPE family member 4-like n=1 Tax=Protopterus annectens TaxID=7888 RepID=UPI001CFBB15A|nr:NXPE family member 4-like [Protopterus annectens]